MAKESSFDIVSTVDMQEIDNAFQQAKKELAQRYDLKDSGAEITLDKAGKSMTVAAPADFVAKQVIDVIGSKLVRRGIDLAAVQWPIPKRLPARAFVRSHHRRRHRKGRCQQDQQGYQGREVQGEGPDRG